MALLLLSTAVLHLPSLFSAFFNDDYVYAYAASQFSWDKLGEIFTSSSLGQSASGVWWTPDGDLPFYRPVAQLMFALDYYVWGASAFGFHLSSSMLHLVCVFLTWRLVRRWRGSTLLAVGAACVFALHPIHNEAVNWISGRFDLLVCTTTLLAALSYLNWREEGPHRWFWGAATILSFIAGLGSKETALILPAVVVGAEFLIWMDRRGSYRLLRPAFGLAVLGTIASLYIALRFALFGGLGELPQPYGIDRSHPLATLKAIAFNLGQYLLDFFLFIHVDGIYLAKHWSDHPWRFGAGVGLSIVLLVVCCVFAWRVRSFRLGAIWLSLFTAPSLLAMPGERNVYLASVGLALMLAATMESLWKRAADSATMRRHLRRLAVGVAGVWIAIGLVEQSIMWGLSETGEKVYRDLLAAVPEPEPDSYFFIVNQCPLTTVGFEQALKLRYGREDITACALTVSPTWEHSSDDRVIVVEPDTLRIDRVHGVFFESFIERFHLFAHPTSFLASSARRFDLILENPPLILDGLTRLTFKLPGRVTDPGLYLYYWDNDRIRGRADFFKMMELAELTPVLPDVAIIAEK